MLLSGGNFFKKTPQRQKDSFIEVQFSKGFLLNFLQVCRSIHSIEKIVYFVLKQIIWRRIVGINLFLKHCLIPHCLFLFEKGAALNQIHEFEATCKS